MKDAQILYLKGWHFSVIVGSFETITQKEASLCTELSHQLSLFNNISDSLANNPIIYRPRYAALFFGQLWCHGCYERKADRTGSASDSLDPIPIPRDLCRSCR